MLPLEIIINYGFLNLNRNPQRRLYALAANLI